MLPNSIITSLHTFQTAARKKVHYNAVRQLDSACARGDAVGACTWQIYTGAPRWNSRGTIASPCSVLLSWLVCIF